MVEGKLLRLATVVVICLLPLAFAQHDDDVSPIDEKQPIHDLEGGWKDEHLIDDLEREWQEKLKHARCFVTHNSTCVKTYPGSSCEGEHELRCWNDRHERGEQEKRGCTDKSYRVYNWKQIAKDASTPTNNVIAVNDDACEDRCWTYGRTGSWVVGWTRDWDTGRCQCFVIPYGTTTSLSSAVRARATTGFLRNNPEPTGCGSYLIDRQRIWADVIWRGLSAGPNDCSWACRSMDIGVFTSNGIDCYCINSNWRNPPMTYTPGENYWSSGFRFF